MFEEILKLITAALTLWNNHEKQKYVDKILQLKKDYHEEYSKPIDKRSDAVLDNLEFELRITCAAFASAVGTENAQAKS